MCGGPRCASTSTECVSGCELAPGQTGEGRLRLARRVCALDSVRKTPNQRRLMVPPMEIVPAGIPARGAPGISDQFVRECCGSAHVKLEVMMSK